MLCDGSDEKRDGAQTPARLRPRQDVFVETNRYQYVVGMTRRIRSAIARMGRMECDV